MARSARLVDDVTVACARQILTARRYLGLTQRVVADRAGLPISTYSAIEQGKCTIDIEQLYRIGRAVEVDADQLLRLSVASTEQPETAKWARSVGLTMREREVLRAYVMTNTEEGARQLFISQDTFRTHLARIRQKYRRAGKPAGSRSALAARAIEDRLVTANEL